MYNKFRKYIMENDLVSLGDSLILGVSGGPDSIVMLDLFNCIKEEYDLEIVVFHLNHMFREEAEQEADFVKKIANNYKLESVIEKFDVPKYIKEKGLSPEEGARKARFDILKKYSKKLAIKKVAMAHNKDDLVETVFLNLIRGTGLKGLTGIEAKTSYADLLIIHPLLSIFRTEIEEYCSKEKLRPIMDPSNKETYYTRNKLRHHLLPYIEKEINPAVKDVIYRTAAYIKEDNDFLSSLADEVFQKALMEKEENKVVLSLTYMQKQETVIRKRLIKIAVKELQGHVLDLYAVHYSLLEELISSGDTGKSIDLKDDIKVRTSYNNLVFEIVKEKKSIEDFQCKLPLTGDLKIGNYIFTLEIINKDAEWRKLAGEASVCLCDFDKVKFPLVLRNRRNGDKFYPFGMKGSKKLKDFFIDEKIPVIKRKTLPLLVDAQERIVWIPGYRTDNRFKIGENTRKILKIGINSNGGD